MPRKRRVGGGRTSKVRIAQQISAAAPILKKAEDIRNGKILASRSYKAWEKAIEVVEDVYAEYKLLRGDAMNMEIVHTSDGLVKISECQERLMRACKVVLPYEKPKLQVVKLQGDRNAPLFDLSTLSDKELQFLRRTVLKAQEVPEEEK